MVQSALQPTHTTTTQQGLQPLTTMGRTFERIEGRVVDIIKKSQMYFIASAPRYGKHINVSPKGYIDSFKILGPTTVAFIETYGSGCETLAHVRENGRICVMFCAFEGDPAIVRLHGYARCALQGTREYKETVEKHFSEVTLPDPKICRSVIIVEAFRISTSCGYGVPFYEYKGPRRPLNDVLLEKRVGLDNPDPAYETKFAAYGATLDGLPGAGSVKGKQGVQWRTPSVSYLLSPLADPRFISGVVVG
eukprot:Sspe_Gene.25841::Locus_10489_Transcript_1_2_Confidence_0.750_Length_903::g.25841::m.25841